MRERQEKERVKNENKHNFAKEKGRNLLCWGAEGALKDAAEENRKDLNF